jgi:hypothetical protein
MPGAILNRVLSNTETPASWKTNIGFVPSFLSLFLTLETEMIPSHCENLEYRL